MDILDFIISNFREFLTYTGFVNATVGNLIMIVVGIFFIWLAIKKDFEPLLLVPIGLGIVLGNIPFRADAGLEIGLYEQFRIEHLLSGCAPGLVSTLGVPWNRSHDGLLRSYQ